MSTTHLESWVQHVPLMAEGYHLELLDKVTAMRRTKSIFPPRGMEFAALEQLAFQDVKVVLLGQDPYHRPGQAHGLSFSVPEGTKLPPSLRNIFKEIDATLYPDQNREHSTDLSRWVEQGVLLLNASLTVEEGKAASHSRLGWLELTAAIVQALALQREHLVFLLWGGDARKRGEHIDRRAHCVLEAAHPSPLSAYRGFFGCNHFALANDYLISHSKTAIEW